MLATLRTRLIACLMLGLPLFTPISAASTSCVKGSASADCVEVGSRSASIAIGAGVRENPVVGRDDIPLILLPSFSYHGKRLSLENLNLSYLLAENNKHSLHLLATPSLEHMFFNDWSLGNLSLEGSSSGDLIPTTRGNGEVEFSGEQPEPTVVADQAEEVDSDTETPGPIVLQPTTADAVEIDELHDRNLALLAGFEYGLYLGPMYFGLQALQDISAVHKGQEIRFAASYQKEMQGHRLRASAGVLWKSNAAMDYYYGVRENEVESPALAYEAGAGASYFARVSWSKKLSDHWSLISAAYYRQMSREASDSPLVDKDSIATIYIGGVYHF